MDSILTSIKKLLGIVEDYEQFDPDIIAHINNVFMTLTQIGVGPSDGFVITDKSSEWSDFVQDTSTMKAEWIKSYVYMKVRLIFDPPSNNAVTEQFNKSIEELEWRFSVAAES